VTADQANTAIDRAVVESRDGTGRRIILVSILVLAAGVAALMFVVLRGFDRVDSLENQASDLGQKSDSNARAAQLLADQVTRLGGVPVVQPPTPEQGPAGERGPAGRGIAGTAIVDGRLIVAFDDGTTRDVGAVVGQPGANGPAGRGVLGTAIVAGRLVLSYSDGTTEDVGQVVGTDGDDGAPGRGVTSVSAVDARLVVSFSDGTTQDAGPLPAGPPGRGVQRAEVVDCRWKVTYTDGTTEDAGNACTTETVIAPTTTTAPAPVPPLLPSRR
jgi:hypothetical protein